MKRILIVCLLGMGLLLPATNNAAKGFSKKEISKRIVDVTLEGHVLLATSDATTGGITEVKIFNNAKQKVIDQTYGGGYSYSIDLSGLPNGTYSAQVITSYTVYSENFTL